MKVARKVHMDNKTRRCAGKVAEVKEEDGATVIVVDGLAEGCGLEVLYLEDLPHDEQWWRDHIGKWVRVKTTTWVEAVDIEGG